MVKKRCFVVESDISEDSLAYIQENQRNDSTANTREGETSAFACALEGSREFLKVQGYIDDKAEE